MFTCKRQAVQASYSCRGKSRPRGCSAAAHSVQVRIVVTIRCAAGCCSSSAVTAPARPCARHHRHPLVEPLRHDAGALLTVPAQPVLHLAAAAAVDGGAAAAAACRRGGGRPAQAAVLDSGALLLLLLLLLVRRLGQQAVGGRLHSRGRLRRCSLLWLPLCRGCRRRRGREQRTHVLG